MKRIFRHIGVYVVLPLLVALAYHFWMARSQYQANMQRRGAFVERVCGAGIFAELVDAGLFLPRDDGTWILLRSDTGWRSGNWTLAVDSEGKWLECNAQEYELMGQLIVYRADSRSMAQTSEMLGDPTLDAKDRAELEAGLVKTREHRNECYPGRLQRAATLAEARGILYGKGFHDAKLPAPTLAGVATRPAGMVK